MEVNRLPSQCYSGLDKNQQATALNLIQKMRNNIVDDGFASGLERKRYLISLEQS